MIFTFKDDQKIDRLKQREAESRLRVWEKNRPLREGKLRKLCETDIEPTQLAINPNLQSKVNVAEAAGYTVPIERPKNRENRYKFIEKKREMRQVQQMLVTKQQEIKRLDELTKLKDDGLHCAETMLETDTHNFLLFFNKIKDKTQQASTELDARKKEKNEKQKELRHMEETITGLVSNINKNLELL